MKRCLKFLFWNICKKTNNIGLITNYGKEIDADIIAVCENDYDSEYDYDRIKDHLNGFVEVEHIDTKNDIAVFAKPSLSIEYTKERARFCLLRIGDEYAINLGIVHFNSNLRTSGKDYRDADIQTLLSDLKIEEQKYGNQNTVITGDFNESPFDELITRFSSFNSVFFRCSIGTGITRMHENEKDVFYNPMVHLIRDSEDTETPKGSYFYTQNNRWYCYDQVMMKKPIAQRFNLEALRFVSVLCSDIRLVEDHKINKKVSDHIPIYFELLYEEGKM